MYLKLGADEGWRAGTASTGKSKFMQCLYKGS